MRARMRSGSAAPLDDALAVVAQDSRTSAGVAAPTSAADLVERHVEVAQQPDRITACRAGRDVQAVAGERVDEGRREQARLSS